MAKYKARSLEKCLNKMIGKFPVILIEGTLGVGKTTLLNHLQTEKKNINYVSLDNMLLKVQANENPEGFLRNYETPLIIDEFQYAPNLLNYIKIRVDEARKNAMFGDKKEVGTMYYLTSSQIFETMSEVSESLAGRVGILDLYGFSTREIYDKKDILFVPDIDLIKKKATSIFKGSSESLSV